MKVSLTPVRDSYNSYPEENSIDIDVIVDVPNVEITLHGVSEPRVLCVNRAELLHALTIP